MGNDGGSIPKRHELVKEKDTRSNKVDSREKTLSIWSNCFISGEPLACPVASCGLGRLYNKEAVLKFLLDRSSVSSELQQACSHIKSLKDVTTLKLAPNTAHKSPLAVSVSQRTAKQDSIASVESPFVCPITGKEMNGNFRFVYKRKCGCCLSEQAFKELSENNSNLVHASAPSLLPNDPVTSSPHAMLGKRCLLCDGIVDDVIPINGRAEEIEMLRKKLQSHRSSEKSSKRKHEGCTSEKNESHVDAKAADQIQQSLKAP